MHSEKRAMKLYPGTGSSPQKEYRVLEYINGYAGFWYDDDKGVKENYTHLLVPMGSSTKGILGNSRFRGFIRTMRFLKDETTGHLVETPYDKDQKKHILQEVRKVYDRLIEDGGPNGGELKESVFDRVAFWGIFDKKEYSFGYNFRYLWRYNDTIQTQGGKPRKILVPLQIETVAKRELLSGENSPRKILVPLQIETEGSEQVELSMARLLFGYIGDSDIRTDPILVGENRENKLAGRVSINHAVEVLKEGKTTPEERFIPEGYLVELGSPKASSPEHYLQQDSRSKTMKTYGLSTNEKSGELAGRKFYLHQKDSSSSQYFSENTDNKRNERSALAHDISKKGVQFRFAIRYKNLRAWELGALVLALQLKREHLCTIAGEENRSADYLKRRPEKEGLPYFAHKIGHGRPLGLGSVRFTIENKSVKEQKEWVTALKKRLESSSEDTGKSFNLTKWREEILLQWLKVLNYADSTTCSYPRYENQPEIFRFHQEARKAQFKAKHEKDVDTRPFKLKSLPD